MNYINKITLFAFLSCCSNLCFAQNGFTLDSTYHFNITNDIAVPNRKDYVISKNQNGLPTFLEINKIDNQGNNSATQELLYTYFSDGHLASFSSYRILVPSDQRLLTSSFRYNEQGFEVYHMGLYYLWTAGTNPPELKNVRAEIDSVVAFENNMPITINIYDRIDGVLTQTFTTQNTWEDGRIIKAETTSLEFPNNPFIQKTITYKYDTLHRLTEERTFERLRPDKVKNYVYNDDNQVVNCLEVKVLNQDTSMYINTSFEYAELYEKETIEYLDPRTKMLEFSFISEKYYLTPSLIDSTSFTQILGPDQEFVSTTKNYYSLITNINNLKIDYQISIYPNPTSDYVQIDLNNPSMLKKPFQLSIFNSNGQQIYQNYISDKLKIPLNQHAAGSYFIKIGDAPIKKLMLLKN